jgi:hypothetical protein
VDSEQPLTLIDVFLKLADISVSLCSIHLAQVTVVNGIQRNAKHGQIKDNERLELWCRLYAYVTATSLPLWDLENFDCVILVAQSVQVLNIDGKSINNPQAIASAFNEYFLSLVEKINLNNNNNNINNNPI